MGFADPVSPAHSLQLLNNYMRDGVNLFECVTRNPFHIDPDYEFHPEQDYLHDIRLMKHHLKCHTRTIKDLGRYR